MNDPFWRLPVVPSFTVTSTDVTDGQALPPAQMSGIFGVPGGKDISPQLSWSGAPAETKSYTVTTAALPNDARLARFIGAAPPPGDGRHRYVIVVQAIGIERVGQLRVQADSTPAWLGLMINTSGHLLARAVITAWAEIPAA